jgi:hypothetical protein
MYAKWMQSVSGQRRRTLACCLDVQLMVEVMNQIVEKHLTRCDNAGEKLCVTKCLMTLTYSLRFFNRVSTVIPLAKGWLDMQEGSEIEPPWTAIASALQEQLDDGNPLFKAHARPPRAKSQCTKTSASRSNTMTTNQIDKDFEFVDLSVAEFMTASKAIHANPHWHDAAGLLVAGLPTSAKYDEFYAKLVATQKDMQGLFGPYRLKVWLDNLIAGRFIHPSVVTTYPVAHDSGTSKSLLFLFGLKTCTPAKLSQLLQHLFVQLQGTPEVYLPNADSLATASLTLCGWHRHKYTVENRDGTSRKKPDGTRLSGLDRAIEDEDPMFFPN